MPDPLLKSQVDAAEAYEALMVPALFGEWASRVADAARIQPGERVLDVACGTGVLAREVLARTGTTGFVAGLDPVTGMLEVAERLAPDVEWKQGVAESLPFPEAAFDVVVSQFGLMFFSDRVEALRQVLRVLRPGGRFAFAVWDSLKSNPAYADEVALLERMAGPSAADALRAPFALGNRADLATFFADAGVDAIEVVTHMGTAGFPSIRTMVEADLRGWLPVMGTMLTEQQIADILAAAELSLNQYVTECGVVSFGTSAHIVTGTRP